MGSTSQVDRVQTGMRIEKRMVKVLKALTAYLDMSLGDLIERIFITPAQCDHIP